MSSDGSIRVLPCTFEAAKHAVLNWHYSKAMPAGKLVKYGVWDDRRFWGAVIFGRGTAPRIGEPYNLKQVEVCELVRVALDTGHDFATSQAVASSLRRLRHDNPGLRLIVSFADPAQGHNGSIYQAMNWVYVGTAAESRAYTMLHGKPVHQRSITSKYGTSRIDWLREHVDPNAHTIEAPPKHKYVYPLDRQMRKQIEHLRQPFPKERP